VLFLRRREGCIGYSIVIATVVGGGGGREGSRHKA